jgi:hypothetical protein
VVISAGQSFKTFAAGEDSRKDGKKTTDFTDNTDKKKRKACIAVEP